MNNTLDEFTKLSDLAEASILYHEKCENYPRYLIDMYSWHTPNALGKCEVCLAGSVMAQRLGFDVMTNCTPISTLPSIRNKLEALNDLREGNVRYALSSFYDIDITGGELDDVYICEYEEDPLEFKKQMRKLINYLREYGY